MTHEEYGRALAAEAPPLTDDQVAQAARVYAAAEVITTAA